MLIVIDKSIVTAATQGNDMIRRFLDDTVTAIRDGIHLIKIDIDDAEEVLDANILSDANTKVLRKYTDDVISIGASIPSIVYEGRLIYWRHIQSSDDLITRLSGAIQLKGMNLSDFSEFKICKPSHLWGEGDHDCKFFLKISESFMHEGSITLNFEERPGGGGNLSDYIKNEAVRKQSFHLCICDNDKHFNDHIYGVANAFAPLQEETANLGQTSKNVLGIMNELHPTLVDVYIYAYCSELENLIPWNIVTEIHSNEFSNIKNATFDKSFFDIKCGIMAKHIKDNPSYTSYWKSNLAGDPEILQKFNETEMAINDAFEEFQSKDQDTLEWYQFKEKYENKKNTKVIGGKRIQKKIMESTRYPDLGKPSIHTSLTHNQMLEWQAISKRVITWGIALNPPLN